jgi:hypothetical protein
MTTTRGLVTDVLDLTHPLPEPPDGDAEPDGWPMVID